MRDFGKLAGAKGWVGKVFKIISGRAPAGYVSDAKPKPIAHTPDDIAEIRNTLWTEVCSNYIEDGIDYQSPDDLLRDMTAPSRIRTLLTDGWENPMSGIGMWGQDPGRSNFATPPILMAPMEASAYYSNGGIPQIIIDKKAKGVLLNGYGFSGDGWTPDETKRLHDYAELLGFGEALIGALRDALIHGGDLLYPALKKDTPLSTPQSIDELLKAGILGKDCIDHFASADRWNCVLVPNWDVTARDYLYPRTIYVPIGGVEVATARAAVIRPRMLDYWGAIRQIGWTTSEFVGWIRPLTGYEIIITAIPIMAQQMSLLVHTFPMDGIIAQDGVKAAEQFIEKNRAAMRTWSMVNGLAINSFGELKTVERHYEGFDALISVSRQHVSASSGLPESVIWAAQPTGLADSRGEDVVLKQSEMLKQIGESIRPQLSPVARVIAISCFGTEYVDARGVKLLDKLPTLRVLFETPVVQTEQQQADSGAKFASMVQSLTASGEVSTGLAFRVAKLFFPSVEVPKDIMDRLEKIEATENAEGRGMEEVSRLFGPDIVQRLTQRMSAKPSALKPLSSSPEKAADPAREAVAEKSGKAMEEMRAEVAAVAEKVQTLAQTVQDQRPSWGERLVASITKLLSRREPVRDQRPQTIKVEAPVVRVEPRITMPPMPAIPRTELPPIHIHNTMPGGGSVSTVDFEVDDKGRIKPGTVKITKMPVNGGKR